MDLERAKAATGAEVSSAYLASQEWLRLEKAAKIYRELGRHVITERLWRGVTDQVIADQAAREVQLRQPDESVHE